MRAWIFLAILIPTLAYPADRSPNGAWERGRILVAPADGVSDSDLAVELATFSGTPVGKVRGLNVHIVQLPARANEEAVARALSRNPRVKFAEVDAILTADGTTNDPKLGVEWHIPKVGANAAWDYSTGTNVVVAVLDTGVLSTHPDLAANMVAGWNAFDGNSDSSDVLGHGTAVAGTVAGVGNNGIGVAGVAYRAKIMPIRICDLQGNAWSSTIASALTWASDHGADVANISFGNTYKSATILTAVQQFRTAGGQTVVSANNNAIDEQTPNSADIIVVSATTTTDTLASTSSWGAMVDLAAPGINIQTTNWSNSYGGWSGTSFASPIVAGTIALMRAMYPTWTLAEIETRLFSTAVDLGTSGYDTKFGWGRVNTAAAVGGAPPPPPPADTTPPVVTISNPADGSTVTGVVSIQGSATDNVGVTNIKLYIDAVLKTSVNASALTYAWDTAVVASGQHRIQVVARDAAGNSKSLNVYVTK